MAFQKGTSTTHITLLEDLRDFLTSNHVITAIVAAAGTTYTLGDILTVQGGTFHKAATVEVTGVTGGAVDTVKIILSGGYTSNPGNPVSTLGGGNDDCTLNLTFETATWTLKRQTFEALSAVEAAEGTGYTIGDDLTLVTGDAVDEGTAAVFNVDEVGAQSAAVAAAGSGYTVSDTLTVSGGTSSVVTTLNVDSIDGGGGVTALSIIAQGSYSVLPGNPVSLSGGTGINATATMTYGTVELLGLLTAGDYGETATNPATTTGGTGTGATLTVTYQAAGSTTEKDMIFEGEGTGSDQIFVGMRSFTNGSARNWELAGFTGYQATSPWVNMPGISTPGRHTLSEDGAYVPLRNSTIDHWFHVTGSRIICVFKMGTTFTNMYLGFVNRFGTAAEYPYPLLVGGCSALHTKLFSDSGIGMSGLVDPIAEGASGVDGPHLIRDPGGSWKTIQNSFAVGGARTANRLGVSCFPGGSQQITTEIPSTDRYLDDININDVIPQSGSPGTNTIDIHQTEAATFLTVLWPTFIIEITPVQQALGELDNVYWVSALTEAATIVSEDTITIGADVYNVFQNCNRSDKWAHLCIKQE